MKAIRKTIVVEIEYMGVADLHQKLDDVKKSVWGRNVHRSDGYRFYHKSLDGRQEVINGKECLVFPSKMNFE